MSWVQLDFIFPFIVFFYGAFMTLLLHTPYFIKIGEEKLPHYFWRQMQVHRLLGLVCLFVGTFWSLQNLWWHSL